MVNKNIICLMILGLFLISFVSAITFTGKLDTNITLSQKGQDYIPDYCNVSSIIFPNETEQLIEPISMVKVGNEFKTSYYFSQLGLSKVCGECADAIGNYDGWCYYEDITPVGVTQSTAQGIGSAIFLFLMLALTFLFGYMGFKFSQSSTIWIVGIFLIFLSFIFVVYDVYLGYEYHRLFTGMTDSSTPEIIFYTFMFLLIAGFFSVIILLILKWKSVFKYIKREIKTRDEDDKDVEDWDVDSWGGASDYGK